MLQSKDRDLKKMHLLNDYSIRLSISDNIFIIIANLKKKLGNTYVII